MQLDSAQTTAL